MRNRAWLNSNPALDVTLLLIGLLGLALSFGWGNWRLATHRFFAKQRLERLEQEARRVAEDIANTIAQERQRRDQEFARDLERRTRGDYQPSIYREMDQRYLGKHMMEAASVINRLREVGYWRPEDEYMRGIGIAGAPTFAAEESCKELYTAADRIKSDLQDGLIALLTQPQSPKGTGSGTPP